MNEWKPIQTSPRTTKSRLVRCPDLKNIYVVTWSDDLKKWLIFGEGSELTETPTDWMPVPKAPGDCAMTEAEEDCMDRLEEALHRVASWAEAYPLSVFPEPDAEYYGRAREVLEANGMTPDRIAAANMRHVVVQIARIARTAPEGKP